VPDKWVLKSEKGQQTIGAFRVKSKPQFLSKTMP